MYKVTDPSDVSEVLHVGELRKERHSIKNNIIVSRDDLMSHHCSSSHLVQDLDIGHGVLNIPAGWKRDLINGRVVYITPSNCYLWSLDEVVGYLLSEGTCKCGLDCPLVIHQVFNFDPCTCIQNSVSFMETSSQVNSNQNLCNHKRKLNALQNIHQSDYQKNQEFERMYHQQNMRNDTMVAMNEMNMPPVTSIPPVHYSLIVPQPILMSSQEQIILNPQLMLPFAAMGHQPLPRFESRKKVRKRNKSKMKTVAAMLKMKS